MCDDNKLQEIKAFSPNKMKIIDNLIEKSNINIEEEFFEYISKIKSEDMIILSSEEPNGNQSVIKK